STLIGTGSTGAVAWYTANAASINLTTGTASLAGHTSDTLIGVTTIYATGNNDILTGGAAGTTTTLIGLGSGDSFVGGAGTTALVTVGSLKVIDLNTGSYTNITNVEALGDHDTLIGDSSSHAEFMESYASPTMSGDQLSGENNTLIAGSGGVDTLVAIGGT